MISGPVRLNNTQLAGFDLGSKLHTLSQLTGGKIGSATGSGTNIRSLSMNIREAGGAIQTDNIALDVAGVGTATGAGTVSAGWSAQLQRGLEAYRPGRRDPRATTPLRPAAEEATLRYWAD